MTFKQRLGALLIPRLPVNRRTFNLFRFELNAFVTRILATLDPRIRLQVRKIRSSKNLCLNLGAGGGLAENWINIDVQGLGPNCLRWDVRRRLPFADNSIRLVYASHVLEHLDFLQDVPNLLFEIRRVLIPGGAVRIVVPDVARFLEAYISGDQSKWAELGVGELSPDLPTPMAVVNHVFHQGGEHQFGYDFETLRLVLERANFFEISRSGFRRSTRFDASLDLPVHETYSLYVEATKDSRAL